MIVKIKDTKYKITVLLSNGTVLDLTKLVAKMSWEETHRELAQKATITLVNTKIKEGYLSDLIKLCTQIYIYADIGAGEKEVFRGTVWEWEYTSSKTQEIRIIAYDKMIYLQKSKDNAYYATGQSTQSIISDICSKWNIPLKYEWESIKHSKVVLKNISIADMIYSVLQDAEAKIDKEYVCTMAQDVLYVKSKGTNGEVFEFLGGKNVISTENKLTLDNLVTKVIVVGKQEDSGRVPVQATVLGKTEYGVLQEIVNRDSDATLKEAQDEANKLLKDRGKPEETIRVEAPDIPTIRKGDQVRVVAGNVSGYFHVRGVAHDYESKTMVMDLERGK